MIEVYDAVESHEELIRWSRTYCTRVVATHGLGVILGPIYWEVFTRAKRRTAAVKTPTIESASVGRATDRNTRASGFGESALSEYTMSLSWRTFESFDREEWSAMLRHELVHVEQFQTLGVTDHGPTLKRHAEAVDALIRIRRFAEPKYTLSCETCSTDVAYRYHKCKLIRESSTYRSACCEAPLHCRKRRE